MHAPPHAAAAPHAVATLDIISVEHSKERATWSLTGLPKGIQLQPPSYDPTSDANGAVLEAHLQAKILEKLQVQAKSNVRIVSILGNQQTGKSTLLNSAFGCNFGTGEGLTKTTNGLDVAALGGSDGIVPLIVDVEGVSSTELLFSLIGEHGLKQAEAEARCAKHDENVAIACALISSAVLFYVMQPTNADDLKRIANFLKTVGELAAAGVMQHQPQYFVVVRSANPAFPVSTLWNVMITQLNGMVSPTLLKPLSNMPMNHLWNLGYHPTLHEAAYAGMAQQIGRSVLGAISAYTPTAPVFVNKVRATIKYANDTDAVPKSWASSFEDTCLKVCLGLRMQALAVYLKALPGYPALQNASIVEDAEHATRRRQVLDYYLLQAVGNPDHVRLRCQPQGAPASCASATDEDKVDLIEKTWKDTYKRCSETPACGQAGHVCNHNSTAHNVHHCNICCNEPCGFCSVPGGACIRQPHGHALPSPPTPPHKCNSCCQAECPCPNRLPCKVTPATAGHSHNCKHNHNHTFTCPNCGTSQTVSIGCGMPSPSFCTSCCPGFCPRHPSVRCNRLVGHSCPSNEYHRCSQCCQYSCGAHHDVPCHKAAGHTDFHQCPSVTTTFCAPCNRQVSARCGERATTPHTFHSDAAWSHQLGNVRWSHGPGFGDNKWQFDPVGLTVSLPAGNYAFTSQPRPELVKDNKGSWEWNCGYGPPLFVISRSASTITAHLYLSSNSVLVRLVCDGVHYCI